MASLRKHWPQYLIEGWGIGTFMLVAGLVAAALASLPPPLSAALTAKPLLGRFIFGLAMGATAISIIYSRWGSLSGAHLNPALTLAYAWLGKIAPWDAIFYIIAQFAGAAGGFALAVLLVPDALRRARDIVTQPGPLGPAVAFAAEFGMTFVLMTVVLHLSNAGPRARFTGIAAGVLVAAFITLEAPLSGMSLNPARTAASAALARDWTSIWIYFTAPPLGMLVAAATYVRMHGTKAVMCAKLNHQPGPCIFRCRYSSP